MAADPPVRPGVVRGSVCTGYGGLDLGVLGRVGQRGGSHGSPTPTHNVRTILAARFPHAPETWGDITTIDWTTVQPVDVLTAGFSLPGTSPRPGNPRRYSERNT